MKTTGTTDLEYEVLDDGGILYDVRKTAGGRFTASVRVYGQVRIEGVLYTFDRDVKSVALKKAKDQTP